MNRVFLCYVRDVFFHESFDKIMGETRTSVKQHIPHDIKDEFCVLKLTINDNNTMAKVTGRNKEVILPDDSCTRIIDHKTFLFLADLCVKAGIMRHD